ncbi:sulfatase-like hydrolase/transferase [Gammaproteobacteria bacterium]|nr:sulfatase-like hydrolase/transferase [Gammaproteobacteria bacterium]
MIKTTKLRITILVFLLAALTAYFVVFVVRSGDRGPNIVFILADDLGWGDLGAYGHPYAKTSNIDMLAAEGTLFHRFYVTGPVCAPSRAGFMTSRSPATYVNSTGKHGLQGRMTITELLNNNGYATGHFGKWVIGDNRDSGTYGIDQVSTGNQARKSIQGRDAPVFEAANAFIESNKDVPFYVNIWTHAVHVPLGPHPSHSAVFKDIEVKREDFSKFMQVKFDEAENAGHSPHEGMAVYLGEIYALDILVGKLLQKLDELGLRENTIVVFSSDNGPENINMSEGQLSRLNRMGYAGGLRGSKHDPYEGGVRSPFLIRWPGIVPAGNVNTTSITSALDWLPTLASIVGVSYDKDMFEGEDVSDIWKGSKMSRKNLLFWSNSAILQGDWKMHEREKEISLYNLSENPEEDVDLADKYPEIVEKLKKKMDEWGSTLPNEEGSKAVVITPADIPESI